MPAEIRQTNTTAALLERILLDHGPNRAVKPVEVLYPLKGSGEFITNDTDTSCTVSLPTSALKYGIAQSSDIKIVPMPYTFKCTCVL